MLGYQVENQLLLLFYFPLEVSLYHPPTIGTFQQSEETEKDLSEITLLAFLPYQELQRLPPVFLDLLPLFLTNLIHLPPITLIHLPLDQTLPLVQTLPLL